MKSINPENIISDVFHSLKHSKIGQVNINIRNKIYVSTFKILYLTLQANDKSIIESKVWNL